MSRTSAHPISEGEEASALELMSAEALKSFVVPSLLVMAMYFLGIAHLTKNNRKQVLEMACKSPMKATRMAYIKSLFDALAVV